MMQTLRLPRGVSLALWLVIVPAILFGLGLWQMQRAEQTLTQSRASSEDLRTTLEKVQAIAEKDSRAVLQFQTDKGPKPVVAFVAVQQIKVALGQVDEDLEISTIRHPMPWVTLCGAVLAFVSGVLGLITSTISGWRARRSQEQLLRSFSRLRVILPFILAALIVGLCLSAASASLFEAISIGLWPDLSVSSAKLFGAVLLFAGITAFSAFIALRGLKNVFGLFTPEPMNVFARKVTEADAPGLFSFIRRLADQQNTMPPDTVIVGLDQGFFVTESTIRLLPENVTMTGRTLYLPAPYLDLLDASEIASIIGHELAHFSGKDTRYTQKFGPIYAGLWHALDAIQKAERGSFILYPATMLGFYAFQQFDHAVNHWSRIREFDADRNGAQPDGVAGAASALVRTGLIAVALQQVLEHAAHQPLALENTESPSDVVAQTSSFVRINGWSDPRPLLDDQQPHPTDTHPPTIQRIQALGMSVDDTLLATATRPPKPEGQSFASTLFADWKAICLQLSHDFMSQLRESRIAHQQVLESLAAEMPGETVLYDNVRPMIWAMAIVAVIFVALGLMIMVFGQQFGFGSNPTVRMVGGAITTGCFILCCLYAFYLRRLEKRPLMILTPTGLQAAMLDAPLAWTDIEGHQVFTSTRLALRLWLNASASLPAKKWQALYTKVDRKKRIITIDAMGIRGMNATEFSGLVERYHNAAFALKELSRLS